MYFTEIDGVCVVVPDAVSAAIDELMQASYRLGVQSATPRKGGVLDGHDRQRQAHSRVLQTVCEAMVEYGHAPLRDQIGEALSKLRLAEEAAREARSWAEEALSQIDVSAVTDVRPVTADQ